MHTFTKRFSFFYEKAPYMKTLSLQPKALYVYSIVVIAIWFTLVNRHLGLLAYPILVPVIPLMHQLFKPTKSLNSVLDKTFVYLLLFYAFLAISYAVGVVELSSAAKRPILLFGGMVLLNFLLTALYHGNVVKSK